MVDKVHENKLRRMVKRRGYRLEKRKRKDPAAWDYGTYQIVDPRRGLVVFCDFKMQQGYGLSLGDVEAWLEQSTPGEGGTP